MIHSGSFNITGQFVNAETCHQ